MQAESEIGPRAHAFVRVCGSVFCCFWAKSGLLSLTHSGVLVKLYWVLSQGANERKPWEVGETADPRVIAVILGDLGLQ